MTTRRTCSVIACKDDISVRHRLPLNNTDVFDLWVEKLNHPRFKDLTPEQIYKSYYVCDRHFTEDVRVHGAKTDIQYGCVPTLYLSGKLNI